MFVACFSVKVVLRGAGFCRNGHVAKRLCEDICGSGSEGLWCSASHLRD
jgi:hypothetical protein